MPSYIPTIKSPNIIASKERLCSENHYSFGVTLDENIGGPYPTPFLFAMVASQKWGLEPWGIIEICTYDWQQAYAKTSCIWHAPLPLLSGDCVWEPCEFSLYGQSLPVNRAFGLRWLQPKSVPIPAITKNQMAVMFLLQVCIYDFHTAHRPLVVNLFN